MHVANIIYAHTKVHIPDGGVIATTQKIYTRPSYMHTFPLSSRSSDWVTATMFETWACDILGSAISVKLFRDAVTLSCNSCSCASLSIICAELIWHVVAAFSVYVQSRKLHYSLLCMPYVITCSLDGWLHSHSMHIDLHRGNFGRSAGHTSRDHHSLGILPAVPM